jgi:hypothetical protein
MARKVLCLLWFVGGFLHAVLYFEELVWWMLLVDALLWLVSVITNLKIGRRRKG